MHHQEVDLCSVARNPSTHRVVHHPYRYPQRIEKPAGQMTYAEAHIPVSCTEGLTLLGDSSQKFCQRSEVGNDSELSKTGTSKASR